MSELSKIVDKATNAIINGQQLSTDNLNDLAKIFYASANRIIEAIDKSAGLHREIVQQLPTQDIDDNIIYMVLDASATGSDVYDEWMWIENAWEHIGSTRVDLSDYYTKTEVDTALSGKATSATSLAGYGITDAYTKTEVDTSLSGKASTSDIPTTLASLSEDTTHRVVTDTEKSTWNGKASSSTSLAGYGITDAYTKTEVDSALKSFMPIEVYTKTISSLANGAFTSVSISTPDKTGGYKCVGIGSARAISGTSLLTIAGSMRYSESMDIYVMNNTGATRTNIEVKVQVFYALKW